MFPFIIANKDFNTPTFFFMIMVASLATTFFLFFRAKKLGFSQIVVLDISLVGTTAGIIGARLFHVFFEAPGYYWVDLVRVFYVWQGGFVGYGAFIGVTLGAIAYLKLRGLPLFTYADFIALGCPLIIFFVRIGCLGAGCCYGKPTDFFLHLTFTHPASDAARDFLGVALHATQVYDLLSSALLFVFLNLFYKHRKFQGQIMLLFFLGYSVVRFFIEFLRGDADRGVYFNGWISTSQIVGVVIWIIGGFLYLRWKKTRPIL